MSTTADNPDFDGLDGERPATIVKVHGGRRRHVFPSLRPSFLYGRTAASGWSTSTTAARQDTGAGTGTCSVTHGGLRRRGLSRRRPILAAEGRSTAIGSSSPAGAPSSYTTLAALAFGDAFSAGGSYFGVADIGLLADHTHKFESRYSTVWLAPTRRR